MTPELGKRYVTDGIDMDCKPVECIVTLERFVDYNGYDCIVVVESGFPMYAHLSDLKREAV